MKKIVILLLLYTTLCHSQFLAINEIDEFTGDKRIKVTCTRNDRWHESDKISEGMMNYVYLSSQYIKSSKTQAETYFLTIGIQSAPSSLCLSQYDGKAIFLFEDGSTIEVKQISDTSCQNTPLQADYKISTTELKKFSIAPVKKLRVYTTSGYLDYDIREKKKEVIMKHFELLYKTVNLQ